MVCQSGCSKQCLTLAPKLNLPKVSQSVNRKFCCDLPEDTIGIDYTSPTLPRLYGKAKTERRENQGRQQQLDTGTHWPLMNTQLTGSPLYSWEDRNNACKVSQQHITHASTHYTHKGISPLNSIPLSKA